MAGQKSEQGLGQMVTKRGRILTAAKLRTRAAKKSKRLGKRIAIRKAAAEQAAVDARVAALAAEAASNAAQAQTGAV